MCYLESVQTVIDVCEIGENLKCVLFLVAILALIVALVLIICEVVCKRLRKICSDMEHERKLMEAVLLGTQSEGDYTIEIKEQKEKKKGYNLTIKKTSGGRK